MRYNWEISKDSSYVEFSLRFYEIGRIKGYFKKIEAEIVAGDDFDNPDISVRLSTHFISTLNEEWDNKLMSPAFISSGEFPFIIFHSNRGCYLSKGGIQELSGELQIRDRINSVTLLVTSAIIRKKGKETSAQFSLTAILSLIDFGFDIKDNIFGNEAHLSMKLCIMKSAASL